MRHELKKPYSTEDGIRLIVKFFNLNQSQIMENQALTQKSMLGILKIQSNLILVSMFLSFILMFIIETFYYANDILLLKVPSAAYAYIIGIAIAVLVQFCRVAFGVSGAYEFAKGNTGKGIFGMLFSLVLAVWCSYEVSEIAHSWASYTDANNILQIDPRLLQSSTLVLQLIVWAGFALEIRLAIAVASFKQEDDTKDKEEDPSIKTRKIIEEVSGIPISEQMAYSTNGNGIAAVKK